MQHVSTASSLLSAAALSTHVDPFLAAEAVAEELLRDDAPIARHSGAIDLCLLFVSGSHTTKTADIARHLRKHLDPACLLAASGSGVIGDATEAENTSAVSALCLTLPGSTIRPFAYTELPHATPDDHDAMDHLAETVGAGPDLRGTIFFADPFSVPTAAVVGALSGLSDHIGLREHAPVVGGLASAGSSPRQNRLVLNERTLVSGGVGLTIRGDVALDAAAAHACTPIGEPFVVTSAKRNILLRLGGHRAIDALRDTVQNLTDEQRERLAGGLYIGRVANEYKPRFGRGDFVIRDVMGVDQDHGAVAVADQLRPGQTVQFHLRDPATAAEDLGLVLQSEVLKGPAAAGLLCSASKRGTNLFEAPHHDARTIAKWLGKANAEARGEPASTPPPTTMTHSTDEPDLESIVSPPSNRSAFPLAGLFTQGELSPIAGRSHLNHQTATLTLFRNRPLGTQ